MEAFGTLITRSSRKKRFGITIIPPSRRKRYSGTISDHLSGVFDFDLDYAGKSILDVGCNIGMIAYEISKSRPKSIQGIDNFRPAIDTAQRIFMGIDTESEFHDVDLTNHRALHHILKPHYDIVLYLSVWHQLKLSKGQQKADEITRELASRCEEHLLARVPLENEKEFTTLLEAEGFTVAGRSSVTFSASSSPTPTGRHDCLEDQKISPKLVDSVILFRAPTRPERK